MSANCGDSRLRAGSGQALRRRHSHGRARRWNIALTGASKAPIEVELPESNPSEAWKKLAELQAHEKLLDRDVKVIDLRLEGRMFIKTAPRRICQALRVERERDMSQTTPNPCAKSSPAASPCSTSGRAKSPASSRRSIPPGEIKIAGIGHQLSKGIRSGIITDFAEAETSIIAAVHAAEQMAGETVENVMVSLSGGNLTSRNVTVEMTMLGEEVSDRDIMDIIEQGRATVAHTESDIVHCIPVSYYLDGARGIADPRKMYGKKLGADLHIITGLPSVTRNLAHCVDALPFECRGIYRLALCLGAFAASRKMKNNWA